MSRLHWAGAVIVGIIVLGLLWLRRGADGAADDQVVAPLDAGVLARTPLQAPIAPRTPERTALPVGSAPALAIQPIVRHSADPCTALVEPSIPAGYEVQTVEGVTIAWSPPSAVSGGPSDVPIRPLPLAHLVVGILEEAGQLTATSPRSQLTIVVYPSREDFLASTKAPAWSDGIYDGGAVRIPARGYGELGLVMGSLRHEIMHAQLHATVGCMPAWFDEGLAMYFAGTPRTREWLEMLRAPQPLEMRWLEESSLESVEPDKVTHVYAQSLAMILYIIDRAGEAGLRDAVQTVHFAGADARKLWEKLYPGIGDRPVLDALARKMFGVPLGSELEVILGNTICCYGLKSVSAFGCRSGTPRPGETYWTDDSVTPHAACNSRW